MKLKLLLMFLAAGLLVSCASTAPYHPLTEPEKIEFGHSRLNVYPEDVRRDPARYAKVRVAWAGLIVSNDATDEDFSSKISMKTIFEHHYFDWEQNQREGGIRLLVSDRGEGRFRMKWRMDRKDPDASYEDAMKYATPGALALVYGTPESVDDDGTIVLRYHYVRILAPAHFSASELDYGRPGESYHAIPAKPSAAPNPPSR
jgi:hypothetical protein